MIIHHALEAMAKTCYWCNGPIRAVPVISKFSLRNNPEGINGFSAGCTCGVRGPLKHTEAECIEVWNELEARPRIVGEN